MHAFRRGLEALDRWVSLIERALLLVSVFLMTALVFVDVMQRTFSRPVGKTAKIMLWFAEKLSGEVSADTHSLIAERLGPGFFWAVMVAACVGGSMASNRRRVDDGRDSLSVGVAAVRGLAIALGCFAVIKGLLVVAPAGVPGAQKFALGFLVWAGFLGAANAARTRRHIAIDAVKKKLGPEAAPWFAFISGLLTAGFCFWLAFLGFDKLIVEVSEWRESDGAIHVFEAYPIPFWIVTMAIPTFFVVIGLRMFCQGTSDLMYGAPLSTGVDSHGLNMDELAAEAAE